MTEPPFDSDTAQRWFAVEFNNRAWDLVEQADRSEEQTREMLHLAHAAALHWSAVGKPINELRAEQLLAMACFSAGLPDSAGRHATRVLTLVQSDPDDVTAFDWALSYAIASKADPATDQLQQQARNWIKELDSGDREYLLSGFPELKAS